jgi:hypothetical protein
LHSSAAWNPDREGALELVAFWRLACYTKAVRMTWLEVVAVLGALAVLLAMIYFWR